MKTKIKILKAYHGDCILIKTHDCDDKNFNILIDGGTANTFKYSLKKELKGLEKIHLLVLTHIDSDHINGIIKFIKNSLFDKIIVEKYWINSPNLLRISSGNKIGFNQGITLDELLIQKNETKDKVEPQVYFNKTFALGGGINAQLLSPTEPILAKLYESWPTINDNTNILNPVNISNSASSQLSKGSLSSLSEQEFKPNKTVMSDIVNASSIAFVLNLPDCSILLLGDSRAEILIESLKELGYNSNDNRLKVNYVKVSHHGSKNNTSCELLDLIDCENYIISTNGGSSSHKHPDRECLARILHHPNRDIDKKRTIYFNYPLNEIESKCGKIFNEEDLSSGNWTYKDNVTTLP